MSENPKECPYFFGMSRQTITCRGVVPGCTIGQSFWSVRAKKAHYAEYCHSCYNRCEAALAINSVWKQFDVRPCPHNGEVDCLHQDECDRCGWNPEVTTERLSRYSLWRGIH